MHRRELLRKCIPGAASVVLAPMLNLGRCRLYAGVNGEYSVRALDLVGRSLVIDMLGLLTVDWARLRQWHNDPTSFANNDLAMLQQSGISVFHPAVDLNTQNPYGATRMLLSRWNTFIEAHPAEFRRISCGSDLAAVKSSRQIGILLGMQDSGHFRKASDVAEFYALGQRLSQLTYNGPNRIGFGCTAPVDSGLTDFGYSIVKAMNAANMMIDVSHAGDRTTLDTFEASTQPVLVTHSNCKALVSHPRCKSDEVIRAMARKGGVMGITAIRTFVSQSPQVTVEDALDHFDHAVSLVGVEHVGIGSDMDLEGRPSYHIRGLNHPRRIFDLTEGLVRRGYSDQSIELILGRNFQRAISTIC